MVNSARPHNKNQWMVTCFRSKRWMKDFEPSKNNTENVEASPERWFNTRSSKETSTNGRLGYSNDWTLDWLSNHRSILINWFELSWTELTYWLIDYSGGQRVKGTGGGGVGKPADGGWEIRHVDWPILTETPPSTFSQLRLFFKYNPILTQAKQRRLNLYLALQAKQFQDIIQHVKPDNPNNHW